MKDTQKTKEQLIKEIEQLKIKFSDLENSESKQQDLNSLKQTETSSLIENNRSYRSIFEAAYDGIVYIDENKKILNVNPAFTKITGIPGNEVIGKSGIELAKKYVSAKKTPDILKSIKTALANKPYEPYQLKLNDKILEITSNELNNGQIVAIIRDIKKRKQTEIVIKETESRLKFLAENANDMIYRMSVPDGIYEFVSPSALQLFGYTPQEFYDTPLLIKKTMHPDWKDYFTEEWKKLSNGKLSPEYVYQIIHKSGKSKWLHQRNILIKDNNGQPIAIEGIVSDITDRKQAEEALRKSEQQYRNFFEKDISGIFLSTPEGRILDFNPAFAFMIGYSHKEIMEMHTTKLYPHPNDRKIFLTKLKESKILIGLELDLVRKDGEVIHCIENVVGDFDENGNLIRFRGYLLDITKRKQTEESLLEQGLFNEQIIRTAMDGFILAETDGKILKVNPSYCQMIGYTEQELLVMNINEFDVLESSEEIDQRIKKLIINGRDQFESIHKTKDGRNIDLSISIVITQSLEKPLVAAFIRDITDQKKANIILKESEQKLRNIFENSTNLFFSHTPDHKLTYISPQVTATLGYTEEEALVKWTQLTSNNPINELGYEYNQRAIDTGEKQPPYELEIVKKGGEKIWVEVREAPVVINGKTTSIVGALIDITERKNAEKTIKESEYLLRESQKVSRLGSYILDFFSGLWESSEMLFEIFGIDEGYYPDVDGWLNIVHPDDKEMMQTYFSENILENFEQFNKEYRIIRQNDKKERWVYGLGKLEFDENGAPLKMIGTIQDITERKLIDEALKESEAKYRTLIENSNDAIYLLYNNKFEMINNKVTEMFGYTFEEINKPGFGYEHLVAPKSKQVFIDRQEQFKKGKLEANKYEIVLVTKAGKELEVEISDSFLDYKDGIANQGYIRDITARKKQQEILMNAIIKVQEDEKYKFGKELHDGLGQVLISASMYLESFGKIKKDLDDNKRKDLEQAQKLNKQAIIDARRISHGLMITGIDEHGILHLIKQLCYNSGGPEITFRFSHKNVDEEKISTDNKVHLYRIVQELSANILKHANASKAKVKLIFEGDNNLTLYVSDNGKGFDTDKVIYGAGLRNIDQRVTIMKGSKEIQTKKGEGTEFLIKIPL